LPALYVLVRREANSNEAPQEIVPVTNPGGQS